MTVLWWLNSLGKCLTVDNLCITQTLEYAWHCSNVRLLLLNSAVAFSCVFVSHDTSTSPDLCILPLHGSGSSESSPVPANWMPPTDIKQYISVVFSEIISRQLVTVFTTKGKRHLLQRCLRELYSWPAALYNLLSGSWLA